MSDQFPGQYNDNSGNGAYRGDQPTESFGTHQAEQGQGAAPYGASGYSGAYYGGDQSGAAGAPQAHGGNPFQSQSLAQKNDAAGFFRALFDFSFDYFITPKVVKFVYILSVIGLGLTWLVFLVSGFSDSATTGLIVLILGPLMVLLYLVFIRMTLEFYLATVRMSEDIHNRLH